MPPDTCQRAREGAVIILDRAALQAAAGGRQVGAGILVAGHDAHQVRQIGQLRPSVSVPGGGGMIGPQRPDMLLLQDVEHAEPLRHLAVAGDDEVELAAVERVGQPGEARLDPQLDARRRRAQPAISGRMTALA